MKEWLPFSHSQRWPVPQRLQSKQIWFIHSIIGSGTSGRAWPKQQKQSTSLQTNLPKEKRIKRKTGNLPIFLQHKQEKQDQQKQLLTPTTTRRSSRDLWQRTICQSCYEIGNRQSNSSLHCTVRLVARERRSQGCISRCHFKRGSIRPLSNHEPPPATHRRNGGNNAGRQHHPQAGRLNSTAQF